MNSKLLITFIFFASAYSSLFSLETIEDKFKNTVVQVKITTQSPNFLFPWQPKKPQTSGAVGVVLANKRAGIEASEIDFIIFATLSPDYFFPGCGVLNFYQSKSKYLTII